MDQWRDGFDMNSSPEAIAVGRRIKGLRDFLALLDENGQLLVWEDELLPEPDIRNISVAAGRDAMYGPAVLLNNIRGYPGKQVVVGVHGSFTNLALLMGQPKGASAKELFYEMVNRWGSDEPLIERISPSQAPVLTNRVDADIDPFDLNQVIWSLSNRTRPDDIIVLPNMPLSDADPSAEVGGKGHRLIIDATSYMPPDTISVNNNLVEAPGGPVID